MHRLSQIASIWGQVLDLLRRACPALSVAVVVITVIEALTGIAALYLVKVLVDAISSHLGSAATAPIADADFGGLLPFLALIGAVLVLSVVVQNLGSFLRLRQGMAVGEYVDQAIHDRAISVDLRFYESPQYYDALERARQGGGQRPANIIANMILTLKAIIVLIGVTVLIAGISPALLPVLLLPIAIALCVRLHYSRKLFNWRMERAQMERRVAYLDWMLTSAVHAKELRLNRIGGFFRDQYRVMRSQIRDGDLSIERARLWTEFAVALLAAAVFISASAWLLHEALTQQRAIGDVALFVLLLRRAEAGGNELVGNASKAVDDHLYLKRLFDFLTISSSIGVNDAPAPIPAEIGEGLRVSRVSFKYEGAKDFALQDVSLEIRPGQIVALVGENGSGKTTLIKLLTRLYEPSKGAITLNGTDIRRFDLDDYRKLFSVIFQDYACYAGTASENIRYGDVSLALAEGAIVKAAERADAANFISRLPQAYETPLTKLFDNGHDLSIGQWQRLALARSFYPKSKFVILDEPTSAVDPKAEFELFEDFRARIGERGALLISHRLSTIRLADYTYVLREGKIAERGTHEELIAQRGAYAELFEKQAQYYR